MGVVWYFSAVFTLHWIVACCKIDVSSQSLAFLAICGGSTVVGPNYEWLFNILADRIDILTPSHSTEH